MLSHAQIIVIENKLRNCLSAIDKTKAPTGHIEDILTTLEDVYPETAPDGCVEEGWV